jgi:hypothetical protein
MADTVKLPGVGPVDKKWLYVGGAAIAGIVGYAYWNSARSSNSEVSDYTTPDYAMDESVDEYVNPGGSQNPVEEDYNPDPTTNTQWGQKAVSILIDLGYDGVAAALAVGKYMARQNLTSVQADMIRAAQGQIGPPPSGNFPVDSTPTPTTPTTPAGKPGKDLPAPKNVRVGKRFKNSLELVWDPVPGATGYRMFKDGYGANIGHSLDSRGTVAGLKPGSRYLFHVRAMGVGSTMSPAGSVKGTTTK